MTSLCLLIFLIGKGWLCLCLSCKNTINRSVDWFVLYKPPRSQTSPPYRQGTEFYYYDSNGDSFQLQDASILSRPGNPLYYTIHQRNFTTNPFFGMYNDQPPKPYKNPSNKFGHSKGIFSFSIESGFWIISSIPRFPSLKYRYAEEQTSKGQICLCVSIGLDLWNHMGKLFHITNPYFYVGGPPNFNSWFTYEYSVVSSVTRGNQPLKIFAKSRVFNADLYSDLIAKTFRDDLRVQTWHLTKICIKQISRIGSMQFYDGFKFRSTVDHSKWAVTENLNWICIADLNIRETQYGRGGLAVCLNHKDLANEFRSIAWNTIPCKEIPLGVCPSYG